MTKHAAASACLGLALAAFAAGHVVAAQGTMGANFRDEPASDATRQVANWIVGSRDNRALPFIIVDKVDAKVFLFTPDGRLGGTAPALLGLARGDDSVPGIGDRAISTIRPEERTTPAGRFVASLGHNASNQVVLWVDYPDAISLHRVITTNLTERRLQRLDSKSPADNRISYGCINVPVAFYEEMVIPAFTGHSGIVYVLPEVKSLQDVFHLAARLSFRHPQSGPPPATPSSPGSAAARY